MTDEVDGLTNDTPPRVPFVVDETPYCCWEWDLHDRNMGFLRGIDPSFYTYIVDAHAGHIADTDEGLKAAMAIRLTYAQALETFFALVGALVQAPECVYGWLLRYKNHELRSLVGKISRSEHVLSRLKISPTWKNLSRGVHQSIDCSPEKKEWIITGFEKAWERFASDFLDVTANTEYNSVKHGLRAQLGGFTVAIGPSDSSEDGRRPESMKSLGGSKFGSSFHKIEPFPNEKLNFRGRKVARNWVPENLVDGVHLLAWSIGNVVTALRIMNRDKSTDCEIRHPQTLDLFDAPWAKCPGASSFTLDTIIKSDVIKPLSKDQILDSYLRNEEGQVADNQS